MRSVVVSLLLMLCCVPLIAQQHNQQQIQKLNYVYNYLRNNYVDDIDLEPLVESAIEATLQELDPHSSYIPREEMLKMLSSMDGEFTGIGISFTTLRDTVIVSRVIPDSPAEYAGLRKNDRIVAIDGKSVVGSDSDTVQSMLRGRRGDNVSLTIARRAEEMFHEVNIKRGDIATPSIVAAFMIDDIAYIYVNSFLSRNVVAEFKQAAQSLSGAKGMIIDLRDNAGGLLAAAVEFSELFLKRGDIIVSTIGRKKETIYEAMNDGEYCDTPLVVLINENSASASEIVSGALQDHDRAAIIGRRSYGKGLVQRLIKLNDESGFKITIAHYYTPSGRDIQRPYNNGDRDSYFNDMDRYNHPDSIHYDILPKYTTLRNGRIVYGGGGIIPDVYITPGSGHQHTFVPELTAKGLTHELIATYFDSHDISTFRRDYPTLQSFIDGFDFDDEFRDYIINIVCGGDKNLAEDKDSIAVAIDMIKAQIADDIYGHGAYYRLFGHTVDDTFSKAIEIVKDREMMESLLGAKE